MPFSSMINTFGSAKTQWHGWKILKTSALKANLRKIHKLIREEMKIYEQILVQKKKILLLLVSTTLFVLHFTTTGCLFSWGEWMLSLISFDWLE